MSLRQSESFEFNLLVVEGPQAQRAGNLDVFHLTVEVVAGVVGLRERNGSHARLGAFGGNHS